MVISPLASADYGSDYANIQKYLECSDVLYSYSECIGNEALQWREKYQSYVNNSDILNLQSIYPRTERYEIISEVQKIDITSNIINMFEMLRDRGDYYIYCSNRLYDILEDEPELSFDAKSFISLYKFVQRDDFKLFNLSLQVSDDGKARLQKTNEDSFIFIEFLEDNRIFYNIMLRNKDITNLGTYNDFFKDLAENPILC